MNNSTEETVTESIEVQTEEPVKNSETDNGEIKKTETEKKTEKKIKKYTKKNRPVVLDQDGNAIDYNKREVTWRERLTSGLFLGPSLIGVMLFFVLPFFVVIYYANIDSIINKEFVGMQNFQNVLNNSAFRQAAKNTATFSLISVPLAIILSLVMALILEKEIPMKSTFRTFFLSPLMVPVASIVLIWQVLFDYHGVINQAVTVFGGDPVDWFKSSYSQVVVVILFLWKNLGYNMILFMAALSAIPKDVLEVSVLDGATVWKKFWHIKLRYITPTIFFVGIMSLINSFKVFREVYLLTGEYPFDSLYMLQHFMNNTFKSLDYQKLSAAAIIMCVVMIVIVGILFIFEDKLGQDVEG